MTPELALQDAITAILVADPIVNGIVAGKVFDEVPDRKGGSAPPWVYLGPVNRRRVETGCDGAWTVAMRLYAASTGFGRREAWTLGGAISDALEGQQPALAAPYQAVEVLHCVQAGDVIEPTMPKTVFVDVTTVIARST